MDDSQSAGRKPKRFFSDEFKRDAIRLIVEEKYTFRVAADTLGVREQSLRQWHAKLAPKPEPCGEHAKIGRAFDMIAGQNAQTARVNRHRFVQTELGREVGHRAGDAAVG